MRSLWTALLWENGLPMGYGAALAEMVASFVQSKTLDFVCYMTSLKSGCLFGCAVSSRSEVIVGFAVFHVVQSGRPAS